MRRLLFLFFPVLLSSFSTQAQIIASEDTTICLGGTALIAVISAPSYGTSSYTFETIPYAPEIYAGTGITLSDDSYSTVKDIGFDFCFLGETYNQFYIGSNGWISFGGVGALTTTYTSAPIPSVAANVPKNCIMGPWQDWHPGLCGGTCIKYQTIGTAPFRKLVVSWDNVPMYSCTWLYGQFQIVLNETTNIIENHITNKPNCLGWAGGTATQGVHSLDGLTAFTAPGRNSTAWTASNESTRFVPSGITWYVGATIVGYGDTLMVSPTTTTTYTASLTACDGTEYEEDVVVTVVDNDPSFNYLPTYCTYGSAFPVITGDPGGEFSAAPPGMVIDPVTGEIDLDATMAGVYTITYEFGDPCFETATDNVNIVNDPNPDFTYPDTEYCPTGTTEPDYIAAPGGTFTVSPGGLTINAATGEINLTTGSPGTTYTITYSIGAICVMTSTFDITITDIDDASFAYDASNYCPTGTELPLFITTPGGTFTVSPPSLDVNATTGEIDLTTGTPGTTYTITYTTPAGPCSNNSTFDITIDPLDDPSFSYPDDSYCPTGTVSPLITGVAGGTFTISPATMTIFAATGTLNLATGDVGTTYTITYTTPVGPCSNSETFEITIDPMDDPSFGYDATDYCPYGTTAPTYITTPGGTFTVSPAGLSVGAGTGVIDFTTAVPGTTYTITYTTPVGPCSTDSSVVINVLPYTDAAFTYSDIEFCASDEVLPNYILNPGGTFSAPTGISINSITGEINLAASTPGGPYDIIYTSPGCSESDTFIITVLPLPVVSVTLDDLICLEADPITITGDPLYGVSSGEGVISDLFDPALAGSAGIYDVTYTYTDANGCVNFATEYIEVIENSVDAGDDVYIAEYTSTTLYADGGSTFLWVPADSLSCSDCPDPVTSIMSTTTFTVTSWDANGCVATDDVIVNIVPVFDVAVFIPNTFTPNDDNINDMFFAYGSDLVSIVSMRIFDRWGEEIYFAENISSLDPSRGWDGTFNGEFVNQGVYVYLIEVLLDEGVKQQLQGNVTVIR